MSRLPNTQQRHLIVGRTGSGKTRAAVWHMSQKNLNVFPWLVINHKGEELIDSIQGAQHVDLDVKIKKPGLYVVHPNPGQDDAALTDLMWRIHRTGNCGIYIDEGYMVDKTDPAMQAILTQGRSKHIPMIILSQRPVWLTRFAVSESDFYQLFHLQDKRDRQTINSFIPLNLEEWMGAPVNQEPMLPNFHSIYYDVGKHKAEIWKPVPGDDVILSSFNLNARQRKIFV